MEELLFIQLFSLEKEISFRSMYTWNRSNTLYISDMSHSRKSTSSHRIDSFNNAHSNSERKKLPVSFDFDNSFTDNIFQLKTLKCHACV